MGYGAFAVGACDVDGEVVALGVSHGAAHPRDGFQTALVCGTACSLERNEISVEEIEGLLIGHGFAVCLYRSVFNSAGAGRLFVHQMAFAPEPVNDVVEYGEQEDVAAHPPSTSP